MNPLCPKQLLFCCLIWVSLSEVWHDIVFLLLFWHEAVMILPSVLVHTNVEGLSLANQLLLGKADFALIGFLFQESVIRVTDVLIVFEKTTSS